MQDRTQENILKALLLFLKPIARALLNALFDWAGDAADVSLDVPQDNAAGVALAESMELVESFETARMYLGTAPALPIERIFGVTTFELG